MVEIADVPVTLPAEVEYEVTDEEVYVHRVYIRSKGIRLEVTHLLTPDDWHDVLAIVQDEYYR